jgi:hypothetical protein
MKALVRAYLKAKINIDRVLIHHQCTPLAVNKMRLLSATLRCASEKHIRHVLRMYLFSQAELQDAFFLCHEYALDMSISLMKTKMPPQGLSCDVLNYLNQMPNRYKDCAAQLLRVMVIFRILRQRLPEKIAWSIANDSLTQPASPRRSYLKQSL